MEGSKARPLCLLPAQISPNAMLIQNKKIGHLKTTQSCIITPLKPEPPIDHTKTQYLICPDKSQRCSVLQREDFVSTIIREKEKEVVREKRLLNKSLELKCRELELNRREKKLGLLEICNNPKNWPIIRPFLFHDIDLEIPYIYQPVIRWAYCTWKLTVAGHLINWTIVSLLYIIGFSSVSLTDWCIATFSCGCGIPLSFKMWYYQLYKSAKKEKVMNTGFWTFHVTWSIIWATWIIISLPQLGDMGAGIFPTFAAFKMEKTIIGLCCFSNTFAWFCILGATITLLRDVKNFDFNFSIYLNSSDNIKNEACSIQNKVHFCCLDSMPRIKQDIDSVVSNIKDEDAEKNTKNGESSSHHVVIEKLKVVK